MGDFPIVPAAGSAVIVAAAVLAGYWSAGARRARDFEAKLAARPPLSDADLAERIFACGVTPELPGRVRHLFADNTGYAHDRLLPDDDLSFYWEDIDPTPLVETLEQEFCVTLPEDRLVAIRPTIRALSILIHERRG
jgi:hypothetical protein